MQNLLGSKLELAASPLLGVIGAVGGTGGSLGVLTERTAKTMQIATAAAIIMKRYGASEIMLSERSGRAG